MSVEEKLRNHRTEIINLAHTRGAYNLRIFGSLARGEATTQSDIDILVDLEPGRTIFDLVGLRCQFSVIIVIKSKYSTR